MRPAPEIFGGRSFLFYLLAFFTQFSVFFSVLRGLPLYGMTACLWQFPHWGSPQTGIPRTCVSCVSFLGILSGAPFPGGEPWTCRYERVSPRPVLIPSLCLALRAGLFLLPCPQRTGVGFFPDSKKWATTSFCFPSGVSSNVFSPWSLRKFANSWGFVHFPPSWTPFLGFLFFLCGFLWILSVLSWKLALGRYPH